LTVEIPQLILRGKKEGLLYINENMVRYLKIGREYPKTGEEIVRAALYVYLITNLNIRSEYIKIEHDRIDLSVTTPNETVLYECKACCASKSDLYAACQQARAYAVTKGFQKAFIVFSNKNELMIREVPLKSETLKVETSYQIKWPVTISTINLKGGVGKTSLTCALAEFLCLEYKKRVLVVDLDPQTNATVVLMGEEKWKKERDDKRLTLAHYFDERIKNPRSPSSLNPLEVLVKKTSNIGQGITGLDLIPSSPYFIEIQDEIPSIPQRRYGAGSYVTVLSEFLRPIVEKNDYDFIIIDCPPSLGALTQNGLYVSSYYLIPCIPDWLSTYGIPLILRQAWEFSRHHQKLIECLGIVFCRFRSQVSLHQKTIERYRSLQRKKIYEEQDGPKYPYVFKTVIPETVKAEAAIEPDRIVNTLKQKYGYGRPPLYETYANFAKEFLDVTEAHEKARIY